VNVNGAREIDGAALKSGATEGGAKKSRVQRDENRLKTVFMPWQAFI